MNQSYLVITFESTHVAMRTEKTLEHLDIDVIPTPRQLTTSCGISIRANVTDLDVIKDAMGTEFGVMNQCYIVSKEEGTLTFKKV